MSHLFPLFKVKIISQLFYTGGYLERNKKINDCPENMTDIPVFLFFF